MSRVLLINPNAYRAVFRRPGEPLGISSIAALLRRYGVAADLLDLNYQAGDLVPSAWLAKAYDLVGISLFCNGYDEAVQLTSTVKQHLPRAMVVVGGHQATAVHEHIIRTCPDVDVVVRGEGEYATLELVRCIEGARPLDSILGITYRSADGSPVVRPPRPLLTPEQLSALPPPARDILRLALSSAPDDGVWGHFLRDPIASISASRGCPHHCSFCSVAAFYGGSPGARWRARAVSSVLDEVVQLQESFGVRRFWFVDDSFLVDRRRVERIAEALAGQGLGLRFGFAARADDILKHRDLFPRLRAMGCEAVEIGLESGAQSALDRYRKGTTVEQNLQAVAVVRQSGLRIIPDLIMFDPWTTMRELWEALSFLRRAGLWGWMQTDMLSYTFCACPGTLLFSRLRDETGATRGDPTRIEWDFADPDVRNVQVGIGRFLGEHSSRIDALLGLLGDVQRELEDPASGLPSDARRRLAAELAVESTALTRIPYNLFAGLVREPAARHVLSARAQDELDAREEAIVALRDSTFAPAR